MTQTASRRDRIAFARQTVISDPFVSKRVLQRRVKTEFGVGLSDTVRRSILQEGNSVGSLRVRLRAPGAFGVKERRLLSKSVRLTGNPPYLIKAINDRLGLFNDAVAMGFTRKQYRQAVRQFFADNGWIAEKSGKRRKADGKVDRDRRIKGQPDFFKMLRDLRRKAQDEGDYIPPIRPKPRIDKGDVRAQRSRFRDKQARRVAARKAELSRRRQDLEERRQRLVEKRGK